jgi:hypothetical protein
MYVLVSKKALYIFYTVRALVNDWSRIRDVDDGGGG